MSTTRLSSLLLRWQEAFEQGTDLTVAELCPGDPEAAKRLEPALENLRRPNRKGADVQESVSCVPPLPDAETATIPPRDDSSATRPARQRSGGDLVSPTVA